MLAQFRSSRCLIALLLLLLGSNSSVLAFQEKTTEGGPYRIGEEVTRPEKLALAFRGPESYEVLNRVGTVALDRVRLNPLLNPDARGQIIELGLLAETLAMETRKDAFEAAVRRDQEDPAA